MSDPSSTNSSTRAASRKSRVYVFREFLLKTYPTLFSCAKKSTNDASPDPIVVLDCAGGKGDLSWLLTNVDGLNSVVLDPRITKNRHIVKSINYLRNHPEDCQSRSLPGLPTYQALAALLSSGKLERDVAEFQPPSHMRILVDTDLVDAVRYYRQGHNDKDIVWGSYWENATMKGKEALPLGYKEDDASANTQGQIALASEAIKTILSAKLIVGFHPDQATDSSIDLAEELCVPYCIVPCCVFPSEFPQRLLSGNKVRTYDELVRYLQEKRSSSMKVDKLMFDFTEFAKNLVLYSV